MLLRAWIHQSHHTPHLVPDRNRVLSVLLWLRMMWERQGHCLARGDAASQLLSQSQALGKLMKPRALCPAQRTLHFLVPVRKASWGRFLRACFSVAGTHKTQAPVGSWPGYCWSSDVLGSFRAGSWSIGLTQGYLSREPNTFCSGASACSIRGPRRLFLHKAVWNFS